MRDILNWRWTSSLAQTHVHKHTDDVAVEWQFYDDHTRAHTFAHACTCPPLGPQTRWPEGCSCPISVHQVSEYDSNPSEGRTHTFRSRSAFQTAPLCTGPSAHSLLSAVYPPVKQCCCLPIRGSVEKTHFQARFREQLFSAESFSRVCIAPSSTSAQPFTLPQPHWLLWLPIISHHHLF